jgi:undecaprenyl-phosphate 4-deoxy-4-formamido-L-arabinose transferase
VKVSVVVPVFNEGANLEEFVKRLLAVMDGRGEPYELILVDDGSRDRSLEILKSWASRRADSVRVLELSRNFGQHPAQELLEVCLLVEDRHDDGNLHRADS